jgi:hypothetical protein
MLVAGIAGWVTGLVLAGFLNDWEFSRTSMVVVTLVLGFLFTMV